MSFLQSIGTAAQALWFPVTITVIFVEMVGLVSIWAALSRRHWFLRAVGVAAVVAPTAAIPGHDVVLVFMLQSLFVIAGIRVCVALRIAVPKGAVGAEHKPRTETDNDGQSSSCSPQRGYPQFSLLDVMLVVVVVSAVCAVLARAARHIWAEWPAILLFGAFFTVVTLGMLNTVGVLFFTRGPKWLIGKPIRGRKDVVLRIGSLIFVLLLMSMAFFPYAVLYHKTINPIPLPPVTIPDPNGYDDLLRTGDTLLDLGVPDPYAATLEEMADFVQGNPEIFDAIRLGLSRESLVPLTYTRADLNRPTYKPFRCVAWALAAEGQSAQADGRVADAVTSFLDILRLAEISSRGGLDTDVARGHAWEYLGVERLARIVENLPADEARRVIKALDAMDAVSGGITPAGKRFARWRRSAFLRASVAIWLNGSFQPECSIKPGCDCWSVSWRFTAIVWIMSACRTRWPTSCRNTLMRFPSIRTTKSPLSTGPILPVRYSTASARTVATAAGSS